MKKLFKSAFKSIIKSKIGIILLSSIVFLTAGTFTLFNSASNAFQKSYKSVTEDGNLHDFTVKELYSISGSPNLEPKATKTDLIGLFKIDDKEVKFGSLNQQVVDTEKGEKYLIVPTSELDSSVTVQENKGDTLNPNWESKDGAFKIPFDSLKFNDSNNDGQADTLIPLNENDISISFMYEKGIKDWSIPDKLKNEKNPNWLSKTSWGDPMSIIDGDHKDDSSAFSIIPDNEKFRAFISNKTNFYKKLFNYMKKNDLVLLTGPFYNVNIEAKTPSGSYEFLNNWTPMQYNQFYSKFMNKYPLILSESKLSKTLDWEDSEKLITIDKIDNAIEESKNQFKKLAINESSNNFKKEINDLYGKNGSVGHLLNFNSVKSIEINSASGARKIVSADPDRKVDSIVKFDGYNMPTNITMNKNSYKAPMSPKDMETMLRNIYPYIPPEGKQELSINDKGFKRSASWSVAGLIPKNASILDPTSFMAYISPSYAKQNGLKYIDPKKIVSLYESAIKEHVGNEMEWLVYQFRQQYSNSIVWVDQTPYIAIGSGTTPDFSYPIIGPDKPMPDVRNEAILFTNEHGYERIEDAFRGSPKENYLAYKFTSKAKGKEQDIINNVETIADKHMSWGNSVDHIVSKTFDTSETVILTPNRIAFLETLQISMLTLSVILTISLITFIIIVISLVIKKHINSHKKNYGILLANGYSKVNIALTSTVISLVSIIIPAGLGYIAGHFMQYLLLDQFANVWTLPITGHAFNWWTFISIIVFPFILVSLLSFSITMWEIRGTIPEILSGASSKMSSYLSAQILGPLKFIGIKTKASMSLFITNISKMLLVFVSTAMAIITIAISISTIHKFDDAKISSAASTSYSYDVTFNAPTKEGGVLQETHLYELGLTDDQKEDGETILDYEGENVIVDRKAAIQNSDKFMVPQFSDAKWRHSPNYLKHLIQTKILLDLQVFASNPWDLAKKLMPENQMKITTDKNTKFIQFAAKLTVNKKYLPSGNSPILKIDNNKYVIDKNALFTFFIGVKPALRNFFWNGFKEAYKQYKATGSLENMPYFINYGSVILGNKDETYTNVTGFTDKNNFKNSDSKHAFNIRGIKENSQYIHLSNSAIKSLKDHKPKIVNGKLEVPVIVNRYFEAYYKAKKGDIINYSVDNAADRFKNGNGSISTNDIRLKIIGFQNSYNDQQVYTLQEYARQAMKWNPQDNMFNGVFTKEKNPVIFNSLSLYSESGFYPGIDKISDNLNDKITKNIKKAIENKDNPNFKDNPNLPKSIKNIDDYFATYKHSPYVTFANVNMRGAETFRFKTTSELSSVLIIFIESITIFLSVLFIIIISIMIIEDNKKFISTLKVMGYRSKEITRIFFGSFIPSFVLAIFVSAPIAFGVAELVRFAIMSFGSILIPISLTWWTILISFGITFIGAMIIYWLSTRSLKNTKMLQHFHNN